MKDLRCTVYDFRLNTRPHLVLFFVLMWGAGVMQAQSTDNWQIRSAIVKDFTKRLETQPVDSLLQFLSPELKKDSIALSDLRLAGNILSNASCKVQSINRTS